jgi:hypothetical protein
MARPNNIPGKDIVSGMILWWRSIKHTTIREAENARKRKYWGLRPYLINRAMLNNPVMSSTIG